MNGLQQQVLQETIDCLNDQLKTAQEDLEFKEKSCRATLVSIERLKEKIRLLLEGFPSL